MKRTAINLFAATVLVFGATAAFGQSASSSNTDNVEAIVPEACTVATFGLNFGTYDPLLTADVDANTTINVTCTAGMSPTIELTPGRTITNGTDTLTYALYSDAYTTPWADGFTIGPSTSATVAIPVPLYGRIAGGDDVSVGTYLGTLNATVNY